MTDPHATPSRAAMFPKHGCGLYLTHNEHRDYYQTVTQFLRDREHLQDAFKDADARRRAMDTNELWVLQWYPDTPVGFCVVCAPTLEEVLELAKDDHA